MDKRALTNNMKVMARPKRRIINGLLLFAYIWALFLGEATHRFIHHLQDESLRHHHSLLCLSESAGQTPADENTDVTTEASLKPTTCTFGLALHALLGQQGQSQFYSPLALPSFSSSQLLTKNFDSIRSLHYVSANHTRGSPRA